MQKNSNPPSGENLATFQANVGEGMPRVFRYDYQSKVLYTDVTDTDPAGGFETQTEIPITHGSKDEFSARCWEMTAAYRAKFDGEQNGQSVVPEELPSEGPGIPKYSQAVIDPELRKQVADVRDLPSNFTQSAAPEPEPASGGLADEFVSSAVIITNQLSAIEDLSELISLYVEDEKIKTFANNIYNRIQGLYYEQGIASPVSGVDKDN